MASEANKKTPETVRQIIIKVGPPVKKKEQDELPKKQVRKCFKNKHTLKPRDESLPNYGAYNSSDCSCSNYTSSDDDKEEEDKSPGKEEKTLSSASPVPCPSTDSNGSSVVFLRSASDSPTDY